MMASVPYVVPYILGLPATAEIYFGAVLLVGQLVGIIFWIKLTNKLGHRGLFIVGLIWAVLTLGLLFFFVDLWSAVIMVGIVGFGVASIYYGNQLVFSDCIDEIVIDTGKRQEGIYLGIRTFMVRLSIIIQAFTFWVIHISTGFNPTLEKQSDLALLGLRIQFTIAPMLIMVIGLIAFLLLYDLTPEKLASNKDKLKELGL
jgi:Na+/melibiose symporter-like transporter